MVHDNERRAGTLILSQFKMFNEAVVYFQQYISPAFWKSFDQCMERFIKENHWVGKADHEMQDYCWLAHPGWVIEGKDCKYWFENYSSVREGHDYGLAVLTGSGIEDGQYGFQFKLNAGSFGGTKKLAAYASTIPQEKRKRLHSDFIDQGKGNFFLPVTFTSEQLSECWQEYGAFPVEHELFTPLRDALEKLLQAATILDSMFSSEADTSAI